MMKIQLTEAGKRFNREWIFRNFSFDFISGQSYAITGINGSGKSTLLQCLAGGMALSLGQIEWLEGEKKVDPEKIYRKIAIAAPYLELIEEFTAIEFLEFHSKFKPLIEGVNISSILFLIGLEKAANKQIRYYSSGMKQRLKLAQAIFSDVPLLLLDEPCTNLDRSGIELYQELISTYAAEKTVVVSSNDINEYAFCKEVISIMDYK